MPDQARAHCRPATPSSPPRRVGARRGFSLLEALVALALASVLLLGGLVLHHTELRAQRRLAAHAAAERALANAYEALRAELVPLESGVLPMGGFAGVVTLDVNTGPEPDVWSVRLTADYAADAAAQRRTLEALLYRP